eukprot:scaffold15196_cov121-Isochrysis_galbana.AAC.4
MSYKKTRGDRTASAAEMCLRCPNNSSRRGGHRVSRRWGAQESSAGPKAKVAHGRRPARLGAPLLATTLGQGGRPRVGG